MQIIKNTVIASDLRKQKQEAMLLKRLLHSFFIRNYSKLLFILFYFFFSFSGFTQNSNKKKVLVVPYNRFEFVSEFDLAEIAEKNKTTTDKIFLLYQKTILSAFKNYNDENFEFIPVQHHLIKPYKNLIKYQNGKFNGKRYNAVNLNDFEEKKFEEFLTAHDCDFVVFITWHDIQKEAFTKNAERRKRVPYAGHYLDYDVFNLFKQRVIGEGRIKAIAPKPNDMEASFALLRTKELALAFSNFVAHIIEQLNNPIQ